MANKLVVLTLFFILPCALSQERIKILTGRRVYLECDLNSTQDVTWHIDLGSDFTKIFTCEDRQKDQCTRNSNRESLYTNDLNVNRSNEVSVLSLLPSQDETFQCHLGNSIVKTYYISLIDEKNIRQYCNVSLPSISKSGDYEVLFSCGFTFQRELDLDANLTLEGLDQNNFDIHQSSQSLNGTLPFYDNFTNIYGAKCMINFLDIDVTRPCTYPNITKIKYCVEKNDAMFECDGGSNVTWYLFDLDGREEDIENRSWTQDGGRSLLIRRISEEDVGKVVMCQSTGDNNLINNGTIGFTVISETSGVSTTPNPKDPVPAVPSAKSALFVLTLLFLALWLITCAVGGVCLFCRREKMKSTTLGISLTSRNATSPNLNHFSNARPSVNEGSGTRGTLSVTTEVRGNPDVSNTNNSAHIPVSEREVDDGDDNTPNRQSNDESHLYFTLEKSPSTMASFRRASTSRGAHGDANPATLDESQSSHWQGYETVGGSNKNPAFSYDLGEYAEVGEHFLGKDPPVQSVRPPIRKKPGREEVKEDDISRLYGKVNK